MTEEAVWESLIVDLTGLTERLRVDGGWLYRTQVLHGTAPAVAMVFVPINDDGFRANRRGVSE